MKQIIKFFVVGLLALLVAWFSWGFYRDLKALPGSKPYWIRIRAMRSAVSALQIAVDLYTYDCGIPPEEAVGLQALIENHGVRNWDGPYLRLAGGSMPVDYWGTAYQYDVRDGKGIVSSAGPDCMEGTVDDIFPNNSCEITEHPHVCDSSKATNGLTSPSNAFKKVWEFSKSGDRDGLKDWIVFSNSSEEKRTLSNLKQSSQRLSNGAFHCDVLKEYIDGDMAIIIVAAYSGKKGTSEPEFDQTFCLKTENGWRVYVGFRGRKGNEKLTDEQVAACGRLNEKQRSFRKKGFPDEYNIRNTNDLYTQMYDKVIEQMQYFKPSSFISPPTNSAVLGVWDNHEDNFKASKIFLYPDGVGIFTGGVSGFSFFWKKTETGIQTILPPPLKKVPANRNLNIIYNKKDNTILAGDKKLIKYYRQKK